MTSVLTAAKIPIAPKSFSTEKIGVGTSVGDLKGKRCKVTKIYISVYVLHDIFYNDKIINPMHGRRSVLLYISCTQG